MNLGHRIPLWSNSAGDYVEAVLHERIDEGFARRVDDLWLGHLANAQGQAEAVGRPFSLPPQGHWRWQAKVAESAHLLSCPTLAIECDGEPQGLMLLMTDGHFGRLPSQEGKPLVYVCYLACAPWNQVAHAKQPRFRGVGTLLTRAAIQISVELEFKGRVGLHSLPAAESFYECHGFACLGCDADKEDLKYYELSPEAAAVFLE